MREEIRTEWINSSSSMPQIWRKRATQTTLSSSYLVYTFFTPLVPWDQDGLFGGKIAWRLWGAQMFCIKAVILVLLQRDRGFTNPAGRWHYADAITRPKSSPKNWMSNKIQQPRFNARQSLLMNKIVYTCTQCFGSKNVTFLGPGSFERPVSVFCRR